MAKHLQFSLTYLNGVCFPCWYGQDGLTGAGRLESCRSFLIPTIPQSILHTIDTGAYYVPSAWVPPTCHWCLSCVTGVSHVSLVLAMIRISLNSMCLLKHSNSWSLDISVKLFHHLVPSLLESIPPTGSFCS